MTNYYYSGSAYTSRTLYRNDYFSSASAMNAVLSTSATGTTNYSTATGPGSSVWSGLSTGADTTAEYTSVANAATGTTLYTKLYTVYQFNVTYAKGANVSAIGNTSGSCKVSATGTSTGGTSCNVATPTITTNSGYLSVGWSTTNGATTGTAAESNLSLSTNAQTYYGNGLIGTPTFSEGTDGASVTITFPRGCSSPYTCSYKINNGNAVSVTTNTVTLTLQADSTVDATATDGRNTTSSTYNFKRTDLYVSSSGNDTSGTGTIASPYATISKAYTQASSSSAATIHIMSNLSASSFVNMSQDKDITLTSCTKSSDNTTCTYSSSYTITRANSNPTAVIEISDGTLTANRIVMNGASTTYPSLTDGALISVTNGATADIAGTLYNSNGRAIYVNSGSTVTFNADIYQCSASTGGNEAGNGGIIYIGDNSTVIQNGGTIGESSATNGGGIYVSSTGTFTQNTGSIYENIASSYGGGIYNNGGTVTIKGTVEGNETGSGSGGGINNAGGEVYLDGGNLTNNVTTSSGTGGGGINNQGGTFVLTSGTISGNTGYAFGGGIDSTAAATITINGGTISNNTVTAGIGGGMNCGTNVTCGINAGTITGNKANGSAGGTGNGGGVSANVGATLYLVDGTISNNTAQRYGGGIFVSGSSTVLSKLVMSGGTITGNKTTTNGGGGIQMDGEGTITGGEITSNTAKTYGGGVYIANTGTLNLRGGSITSNVSQTAYNNVTYGAIYKTTNGIYNVSTSGSQYCNNNGQSNINTQCIFNETPVISITSSKTTQDTQTCSHNNASFGGYGYRYRFNISVTNGSVSSGKMCYSPDSSSTSSFCATYRTSGLASGNVGYACFVSTTTWDFYRANYCVYAVVNSGNVSKTKYQC